MNILFIRPQAELGGVSAHMALLSAGLSQRGHTVTLATAGGDALPRLQHSGAKIFLCSPLYPSRPANLVIAVLRLLPLVRSGNFQVIHSHHRFTTTVGRIISRLSGIPLVITIHEFKRDHGGIAWLWSGDTMITPSKALRDHLVMSYQLRPSTIHVIPNAVEQPKTQLEISVAKPGMLTIGFIGRLSVEKGARYFLESVPLIRQQFPHVNFLIAGIGPEMQSLQALAQAVGLAPKQVFLGAHADVPTLLQQLDLVVVPSLDESFSLVALEAMHQGRPVVASAVGGIPEVVSDGETGLLVAPRSPAALAEAVCRLLADPASCIAMGRAGMIRARGEFSADTLVERTLALYKLVSASTV